MTNRNIKQRSRENYLFGKVFYFVHKKKMLNLNGAMEKIILAKTEPAFVKFYTFPMARTM